MDISQTLDEHQPLEGNQSKPIAYTPDPEERKTIKMVERLFEKAKKHRKKYDENWLKWYHFFRGKQWREARPSYRHSEVINMVWQHIQSVVPITTDARPKWEYTPEDPSDREFAEIMNEVAESEWIRKNWSYTLTEMVYDSNIYGTSLGEMPFDKKARQGLGDIEFKSFDPFYAFPDPNSFDVNKGGKWFIDAHPEDVDKLKEEYPDKKAFIKGDLNDLTSQEKLNINTTKYMSPTDNKTVLEGTSNNEESGRDQALKITLYRFDDDEVVEEEEFQDQASIQIDPVTGEQTEVMTQVSMGFVQKKKYPNGRKVCIASGILLDDGPIPYDDGMAPFIRLVNYIDPRSFWGISEIEQLESPQKIFNKVISFMLDIFHLTGNPIWIVDTNAGIDTDTITNRPGLILEKTPGTEVRREGGTQINPDLFQLADRIRSWFNDQSGSADVTRGVRPEGITAAAAINELQEAAQTRLRLKSRNLDACLQMGGQMFLSRVLQFKTSPEIIRITNNQGATKYFKFHIEESMDEQGNPQKVARVRRYNESVDESGMKTMAPDVAEQVLPIKGSLDVRVNTGSTLPFAKTEKINLAFKLFESGAIDQEELLKAAEYPNWEQVLERQKMAQAQQAALQSGMGAPQGAPPPEVPMDPGQVPPPM